ncbi:MAG: plasmid partition protein ParG [Gaiella sp.]
MKRMNVYLEEEQLVALGAVSKSRGEPVAGLIRQAVDGWLEENGACPIAVDEWEQRFDALLLRRSRIAQRTKPPPARVERDVAAAVAEARSARRR